MNALLFWSRTSEMFMIVNKNSFFCVSDWAFEARSDDSSFQRRPMAVQSAYLGLWLIQTDASLSLSLSFPCNESTDQQFRSLIFSCTDDEIHMPYLQSICTRSGQLYAFLKHPLRVTLNTHVKGMLTLGHNFIGLLLDGFVCFKNQKWNLELYLLHCIQHKVQPVSMS